MSDTWTYPSLSLCIVLGILCWISIRRCSWLVSKILLTHFGKSASNVNLNRAHETTAENFPKFQTEMVIRHTFIMFIWQIYAGTFTEGLYTKMFQLWWQINFSDESWDFSLYFIALLYYFNLSVEICHVTQ